MHYWYIIWLAILSLSQFSFHPIFIAQAEITVVEYFFIEVDNRNSWYCSSSTILDINRHNLVSLEMLTCLNHFPQDLVLLMRCLNCVKDNLSIEHSEVWPEIFRKTIVPILEICIRSSRCNLSTLCLELIDRIVVAPLRSESTIELTFEVAHERPIPH